MSIYIYDMIYACICIHIYIYIYVCVYTYKQMYTLYVCVCVARACPGSCKTPPSARRQEIKTLSKKKISVLTSTQSALGLHPGRKTRPRPLAEGADEATSPEGPQRDAGSSSELELHPEWKKRRAEGADEQEDACSSSEAAETHGDGGLWICVCGYGNDDCAFVCGEFSASDGCGLPR